MDSDILEHLQKEIKARQLVNTDEKKFIPYAWLVDLLNKDLIQQVIENAGIQDTGIDEDEPPAIAKKVHDHDGRRIFAILVLMGQPSLVYNFIQRDTLDSRLPLRKKELKELFGVTQLKEKLGIFMHGKEPTECKADPEYKRLNRIIQDRVEWAGDFKSTQYMFLTPNFPEGPPHRIISDYRRLPFRRHDQGTSNKEEQSPSGNFGTVYKELLPPLEFGSNNDKGTTLVRKELKSKGEEAYKDEVRCLRLLSPIRHPNILELCGSYTYKKKHNLLFREATGGDLHELLTREARPPEFRDDEAFYLAFCGLVSALDQLHDYSNDDLKLKMLGCHHDLKPRNILVDGGKFILADFGLSTLTKEDTNMIAKNRDQYFAAPEGMDYVLLKKGEVGPASDIWSLGCILAVVYMYMKRGTKGVKEFGDKRLVTVIGKYNVWELKAFHDGYGKVNPGVVSWFGEMEKEAVDKSRNEANPPPTSTSADADLLRLIHHMLSINPETRPKTKEVLRRLRVLTLKKASEPIIEALDKSCHNSNLEFTIERHVFLEWLTRIGNPPKNSPEFVATDEVFAQGHAALLGIKDELRILADAESDYPLFTRLRRFNEQLLSCLDGASRRSLRRIVELNIIPSAKELVSQSELENWIVIDSHSVSKPQEFENRSEKEPPNSNILMLLAAEQVHKLMRSSKAPISILDPKAVTLSQNNTLQAPTFRLGTLATGSEPSTMDVIVEEMEIGPDYVNKDVSKKLFSRLENVLSLPRANVLFRALNCHGIYHDADTNVIGLVYRYPDAAVSTMATEGTRPKVVQLAQLLRAHDYPVDYEKNVFFSIDDRLKLAYDLVDAVFQFHKIRWWHKNISSFNILFFLTDAEDSHGDTFDSTDPPHKLSLASPSLIGFSHSRPGAQNEYSNKQYNSSKNLFAFHHPSYGGIDGEFTPYRAEYDYYSLGLVLLEIGQWFSLENIMEGMDDLNRAEKRKALLERSVPFLAGNMGEVYREVVRICLAEDLCGEERGETVDERFERLVVSPLEACLDGMGGR